MTDAPTTFMVDSAVHVVLPPLMPADVVPDWRLQITGYATTASVESDPDGGYRLRIVCGSVGDATIVATATTPERRTVTVPVAVRYPPPIVRQPGESLDSYERRLAARRGRRRGPRIRRSYPPPIVRQPGESFDSYEPRLAAARVRKQLGYDPLGHDPEAEDRPS